MKHSKLGNIGVYNPEILFQSEETVSMEEGCLTFPGLFFHVTRPEAVQVKFYDKRNQEQLYEAKSSIFSHSRSGLFSSAQISS